MGVIASLSSSCFLISDVCQCHLTGLHGCSFLLKNLFVLVLVILCFFLNRRSKWCTGFDELKARVDEYPLERVSEITGVDQALIAEAARLYATADVFMFPSTTETFGNVVLEAMASGLPVVVESKCSGHLVEDGENGFCCRIVHSSFFDLSVEDFL